MILARAARSRTLKALWRNEQTVGLHFECVGNGLNVLEGNVSLLALEHADVCPMQVAALGKCPLGQSEPLAIKPDVDGKDVSHIHGIPFEGNIRECRPTVYRQYVSLA